MNHPALKGEVSLWRNKKMLKLTNPRLRRHNVVLNSFSSCVPDTSEEFARAPEMSFSKVVSQPRMFFEKFKGAVSFKQLKSHTNTHRWRHLNKQVDMINSDVKFVNLESLSVSHLPQEKLTIHSESIEFKGVFGIFNFPYKVEGILSEAVLPRFQIHFFPPNSAQGDKAHANFLFNSGAQQSLSNAKNSEELNLLEDGNSSLCLKAEVSLPLM